MVVAQMQWRRGIGTVPPRGRAHNQLDARTCCNVAILELRVCACEDWKKSLA